jgi:hypothetical protein
MAAEPFKNPKFVIYESAALETTVFRGVAARPATPLDFRSYVDLGRPAPWAQYLRLHGISMFLTPEQARRAIAKYGLPDVLAEIDLRRDSRITFALTSPRTGHIEVWAPPDVLCNCVVGYHQTDS